MAAGKSWSESVVEVAGAKIHLARAGSGRPVVVLHHDIGSPDRLPFYDDWRRTQPRRSLLARLLGR